MTEQWLPRILPASALREVQQRGMLERTMTDVMQFVSLQGRTIGSISVSSADYPALTHSVFVQMRFSVHSFEPLRLSSEAFFQRVPLLKDESLSAGAFIVWTEHE